MKNKTTCTHEDKCGVEFQGGYDGISMYECNNCGMKFDRRSGQRIIIIAAQGEYSQPMFVLEDGSVSWKDQRRYNPQHKKNKPNRIKPKWEK